MPGPREATDDLLKYVGLETPGGEYYRGLDMASDLLRSAILHKLTIIGEAANRLTPELKVTYPDVPWRNIVAFRNVIVHAYFTIDWDVVWVAATVRVPELIEQLPPIA